MYSQGRNNYFFFAAEAGALVGKCTDDRGRTLPEFIAQERDRMQLGAEKSKIAEAAIEYHSVLLNHYKTF